MPHHIVFCNLRNENLVKYKNDLFIYSFNLLVCVLCFSLNITQGPQVQLHVFKYSYMSKINICAVL